MTTLAALEALSPEEIAARLSGTPEERAAFVRACAEAGEAEAQALYGQMLLDGNGVAKDSPAALRWFTKAAAQHHILGLNMVGRCYDLGWGTVPDKARAAECYRVAAEAGLDWGMYNYATLLALGDGVAEDKAAALAWFRKAAATGAGKLSGAKAINFVGSFHEDGWVVARDMVKAAKFYKRAADGGDFRGAFNHARMLGAAGRYDEAMDWLKRAGANGTPAFMEKARAWLAGSDVPAFRARGVQALDAGAAGC
ncbi:tetratricopeptide repeat protein [Sphingomonas immobilis]|uniref:Tetratricopeptide repeat protein n=1 Tax=Sphingomonas immobilis TaxID=3063997 RepID=A0ABT9A302_9SPHN|nr:tetratricopeptide repeat protein [Sphingomonas sp. CA1-15]MDO7843709.1 tetratricopeptide repeat protein [Sphingomonas sp. CA1-15]